MSESFEVTATYLQNEQMELGGMQESLHIRALRILAEMGFSISLCDVGLEVFHFDKIEIKLLTDSFR